MLGQVVLIACGYLGGAIPFGYIAGRFAGIDIRTHGSGNTGATNVWRALGPRWGVPVLVLDMLKGFVPAMVGAQLYGDGTGVLAGGAAILGHAFPVFLGFGGGKGVATAAGTSLAVAPIAMLVLPVVFVAVLWLTRYVSLASLVVCALFPVLAVLLGEPWPVLVYGVLGAAAITWRHRANIARLRAGTEAKARTFGRGASRA